MKKILMLIFLIIGITTFSDSCDWFKENTEYANKMAELIKKARLVNKIYCDTEEKKMVYETVDDNTNEKYIEVGLIYNKNKGFTYQNILNFFEEFEKDVDKLYPWKNLTKLEYENSPKYYNYRMYVYNPETKNEYMTFLITYDASKGTWNKYYSNEFWSGEDENEKKIITILQENGLKETDDIVY
ncbi:hypothetical protein [Leptotrichia alba]|uniref:Lipoprotein n=1 Tax=Leptotrichia alba TaxID=3239304 RepID=A0AB39V2D5_9FUSO